MNTQNEIDWRFIQLKRTQWDENDDVTGEHPLTFSAHRKLLELLDTLEIHLKSNPPRQDIKEFKISDKTYGELSLQWYGPVFELDLDLAADGKISFLLCQPQSQREDWIVVNQATLEELIESMEKLHAFE